jgi:hypothetical protein
MPLCRQLAYVEVVYSSARDRKLLIARRAMIERTPELAAVEDEIRGLARSVSAEARFVSRAAIIVARVYRHREREDLGAAPCAASDRGEVGPAVPQATWRRCPARLRPLRATYATVKAMCMEEAALSLPARARTQMVVPAAPLDTTERIT